MLADGAGLQLRAQWLGRLARDRIDGHRALASCLMLAENALGNWLFINLILEAPRR